MILLLYVFSLSRDYKTPGTFEDKVLKPTRRGLLVVIISMIDYPITNIKYHAIAGKVVTWIAGSSMDIFGCR